MRSLYNSMPSVPTATPRARRLPTAVLIPIGEPPTPSSGRGPASDKLAPSLCIRSARSLGRRCGERHGAFRIRLRFLPYGKRRPRLAGLS